jgi:hypothetical protein
MRVMNRHSGVEVTTLAINVTIPEPLQWTDTRRDETFMLTTLKVRSSSCETVDSRDSALTG